MYNVDLRDRADNFTVIVSVLGAPTTHALMSVVKPFQLSSDLFTMFPKGEVEEAPKSINTAVTQLILTQLSEADDSSKNQQLGRFTYKGKNKVWPVKPIQDQIAAEVMSQIWDRVCGKLEGSSFTYKSDLFQFSAVFNTEKNRYLIYPEHRA